MVNVNEDFKLKTNFEDGLQITNNFTNGLQIGPDKGTIESTFL
jgi:hypothetical protein